MVSNSIAVLLSWTLGAMAAGAAGGNAWVASGVAAAIMAGHLYLVEPKLRELRTRRAERGREAPDSRLVKH